MATTAIQRKRNRFEINPSETSQSRTELEDSEVPDDRDENWVLGRLKESGEFDVLRRRVADALDLNCGSERARFERKWIAETIVRQQQRADAPLPTWKEFSIATWNCIDGQIQTQISKATKQKETQELVADAVFQILTKTDPASESELEQDGPSTTQDGLTNTETKLPS